MLIVWHKGSPHSFTSVEAANRFCESIRQESGIIAAVIRAPQVVMKRRTTARR